MLSQCYDFALIPTFSWKIAERGCFMNDYYQFYLLYTVKPLRKGRFTRYDFCLRLSHAIFVARAARVMKKSYTISTISNLPVATIVVGF